MKWLLGLSFLTFATSSLASSSELSLKCSVLIEGEKIELSYTASLFNMELTKSSDGARFGNAYDGVLKIKRNGVELINGLYDAAGEEYGVIVKGGKLTYVNLVVDDGSKKFSKNGYFYITFGQSFEETSPWYFTDSAVSILGGSPSEPQIYSATCW